MVQFHLDKFDALLRYGYDYYDGDCYYVYVGCCSGLDDC